MCAAPSDIESMSQDESRAAATVKAGVRATWIGFGINFVLMVAKLWAGILAGSQALLADGVDSLSDLFSGAVVLLGLRWGRASEDADHPYGHARIETISGMIVGFVLIAIALGIAYNAVTAIILGRVARPELLAIWVAVFSVIIKEALYWYTVGVGKKLKSSSLIAMAWNYRTDTLSSIAVLVGVGATYINENWQQADSIAAIVVIVFVLRAGVTTVWSAFRELADTAPDRSMMEEMTAAASAIEGVREIHDLRARHSGPQIFVDLHVVVDPDLSVREGHAISKVVERTLREQFEDVTMVSTHLDPELKRDHQNPA